jgi:hypothetical protein
VPTTTREYVPGEWLFACPTVRIVHGWESPKAKDKSDDRRCRLPQTLYDKLPGGHEHRGSRLYATKGEALKALEIARAG